MKYRAKNHLPRLAMLMLIPIVCANRAFGDIYGETDIAVFVKKGYLKEAALKSRIESAITQYVDNYAIVERDNSTLELIDAEFERQLSGRVANSEKRRTGEGAGVDMMLVIDAQSNFLSVRLIDVENQRLRKVVHIDMPYNPENAAYEVMNKCFNIKINKLKQIAAESSQQIDYLPEPPVEWEWKTLLGWRASVDAYGGLMLGFCAKRKYFSIGGYGQARMGFFIPSGSIVDGNPIGTSHAAYTMHSFRRSYTGGLILGVVNTNEVGCYLYGGAGYGMQGKVYDVKNFTPKYQSPNMFKGMEYEAGVTLVLSWFTISAGYTAIGLTDAGEVHFGAGFRF